jgi:hypothetical protein
MKRRECKIGLVKRCRNDDGAIRQKRSDTTVRSLRGIYGDDFAPGVRSNMQLGTLLNREGADSLREYVRRKRGGR